MRVATTKCRATDIGELSIKIVALWTCSYQETGHVRSDFNERRVPFASTSGESLSLQRAPIRARPNCSMLAEEQCSLDGDEMDSQVPQWQSRGSGGRWDANLKGRRVGPRRDRKRSEARSIGSLQSPIHVGLQRPRASTRGRSSIAGRCGEQWREDPIAHERRRNSTQAKMAAIPQTRFLQPPEAMAPSQRQDGRKHHRASSASIAPSCRRRTSTRRVCSLAYFWLYSRIYG